MANDKWFILAVVILSVGEIKGFVNQEDNLPISSNNRLTDSVTELESLAAPKKVKITTIKADFGKLYTASVQHGHMYTFVYTLTLEEAGKAIRVHVSTLSATADFPVLFVVKEQKDVISWQVPLILEDAYSYYNISRTLCPTGNIGNGTTLSGELSIDVSTMSQVPVEVLLEAEVVDIGLSLNRPQNTSITPSEPKIYRYSFSEGEDTVVVKMRSEDAKCMVLSIQTTKCPVYDLTRNVEFTGFYQTVDGRGAITVRKSWFETLEEFFVVLVLKPNDYDCNGIETIHQPGTQVRRKFLNITVQPDITDEQYIIATTTAAAWFLLFYVLAFVISCVYHFKCHSIPQCDHAYGLSQLNADNRDKKPEHKPLEPTVAVDEYTPIVIQPGVHSPLGENSQVSYQYGATTSTADTPVDSAANYADTAGSSSGGRGNGIPHRIPPPDESESDFTDIDERDTDMLHDADHDKDIFRTKTFLYVMDLARKPRKTLAKKYKLYPWSIVTIAVFYGLPVIQLVITYQKVLNVTGNEDICYYNFDCAHRVGVISAFNNVYSNIGYVMLGLLFLILVYRRDVYTSKLVEQNDRYEKHYGIPQHYGLFYAMGIALAMEGILSACYHVCPSYSNFQFDTSFMYMIAWLCMLKIYQTRHPDINAHAHVAYFAIAVVIFLAVLGVFAATIYYYVIFFVIQITTCVVLSLHLYYMGRWKLDAGVFKRIYLMIKTDRYSCMKPMYMDRMILLIIGNIANWSLAICGVVFQPKDFASYLLAIFMVNLLMYFAFYIIMKLRSKEKILLLPLMYIILAAAVWGGAFYFFFIRITSWQKMPARSRDQNQDCILLGFYDSHDIWHFLSAMSMFFGFMVLLTLDDDLIQTPRDRIPVF